MKEFYFLLLILAGIPTKDQFVVGLEEHTNQPIVKATLNGETAYFLIDTGAEITCLHLHDSRKYNFKYRSSDRKSVVSGLNASSHRYYIAYGFEMKLGEVVMTNKFRVLDLTNIINSIKTDSGIKISGIIGSDLMQKHQFVINYEKMEIMFSK